MGFENEIPKGIAEIIKLSEHIIHLKDKLDEDLLNFGISITRHREGKIEYIDPMLPENQHIIKNKNES